VDCLCGEELKEEEYFMEIFGLIANVHLILMMDVLVE
tara:strand:- start:198 stop:308 length:111 start_codon:yes stop_codon:yes gene_type:complete